ncbi:MAG: hypothetical protein JXA50_09615 [Deltaproteobacteria bacterium]|nr:hypothetical protein [Deltaproteobacteria bacterium]
MNTVINPRGQLPVKQQIAMAPRLDNLDGKTIYIVDVRWPYTHQFSQEMYNVLSGRYPKTTFLLRDKSGSYGEDDPGLWAEIQEKGDGVVMAVGH